MPAVRIKPKRGGDQRLHGWLKKLEAKNLLETVSRNVGEEIIGLIKDEFRAEKDPYGTGWKKPKKYPDGRKVLSGKTSRLKGGWHVVKATKRGFTVASAVNYATFHQTGTKYIPQRRIVPDAAIPQKWRRAIRDTIQEAFQQHFNG